MGTRILVEDLQQAVRASNTPPARALEAFLAAYQDWGGFSLRITSEGKNGNLNVAESSLLDRLIEARETTRQSLIKEMGEYVRAKLCFDLVSAVGSVGTSYALGRNFGNYT